MTEQAKERQQCTWVTPQGERCRRLARKGRDRCKAHGGSVEWAEVWR